MNNLTILGCDSRPHLASSIHQYPAAINTTVYNTKIVCCHSVAALCFSSYYFGDERWVGRVEVKLITRVRGSDQEGGDGDSVC